MVGVFAVALGFAQDDMGGGGGGGGGRGGGGGGMGMGMSRPGKLDTFTQLLTLDKEQKKQTKTLLDEAAKSAGPLRDQLAKSKAELSAAMAAGKSQEEIAKLVESYSLQKAQMVQLEVRAFTSIFKPLSPEQQQRPCPRGRGQAVACSAQVYGMFSGIFMQKNWDSN
jgi:Spy/CpxP family protein refolding chaperone